MQAQGYDPDNPFLYPHYIPGDDECNFNSANGTGANTTSEGLAAGSNLLVLGDSLTVGMEGADLAGALAAEPNTINVTEIIALGGEDIDWGRTQLESRTGVLQESDAILVGLGTNNIDSVLANFANGGEPKSLDNFKGDMQDLIDVIEGVNPNIRILWTKIAMEGTLETIYGEWNMNTAMPLLNQAIEEVAVANNIDMIPWDTHAITNNLLDDGIHPNGRYSEMVSFVAGALKNGSIVSTGNSASAEQANTSSCQCGGGVTFTGDGSTFSAEVWGAVKELPADWVPILSAAGQRFQVDPNILAALLGAETSWVSAASFATDNQRNSATATGPFQFLDLPLRDFADEPDQWTDTEGKIDSNGAQRNQPHTSRVPKRVNNGSQFNPDGSHIADGNQDGKVDRATPEDAAFMAAIYIKNLGVTPTTPIGDVNDWRIPDRSASTDELTARMVGAYYNQGPGYARPNATSYSEAGASAKGNNDVGKYMNQMSTITTAGRASGVFGDFNVTGGNCGSGYSGRGGQIIDKVLEYAWVESSKVEEVKAAKRQAFAATDCSMRSNPGGCGAQRKAAGAQISEVDAKPAYVAAVKDVNPSTSSDGSNWAYSDCGVFVSTVLKSSVDPDYPSRGTSGAQYPYVQTSQNLELVEFTDTSQLQPGDVLVKRGHTAIYIGPNSHGDFTVADASWGSWTPNLRTTIDSFLRNQNENSEDDGNYLVGRYVQ